MQPGRAVPCGERAGMAFQGLNYEVDPGVWVVNLPGLVMFLVHLLAMDFEMREGVTHAELSHGRIVELAECLFILLVLTEGLNGIVDELHFTGFCSLVFRKVQERIYRCIEG